MLTLPMLRKTNMKAIVKTMESNRTEAPLHNSRSSDVVHAPPVTSTSYFFIHHASSSPTGASSCALTEAVYH
ncbi:hypothetical protein MTO96_051414 [Rhipicephalus appendiculatus]